MAYIKFTSDTPIITDTGAEVIDDTRFNLMALRDAVVAGVLVDWDMTLNVGGGSDEEPDEILYSKNSNTEAIKLVITWGTTGGANGNPTVIVYHYSTNDFGGSDETIGTLTHTYNGSGTLTASVWS